MREEHKEKLEKNYDAHKTRRIDRILIKIFLIFVIMFFTVYFLLNIPSSLIAPTYKNLLTVLIFAFSVVAIFSYWWVDPIERKIFLDFFEAYKRLGFYFEDGGKFHLNRAESHLWDVLIKMNELSKKTRSPIYRGVADPLKELRKGIAKRIIPLDSKRKNLEQIHEKIGKLALIFLDPNPEKIIKFNKTLKSIQPSKKENLLKKYFYKFRPIFTYIVSLIFVVAVLAVFSFILKFDFLQTLRDGIIGIMVISIGLAGLLERPKVIFKKKVFGKPPVKRT